MVNGRWYATATTLGDGRVMTFSGLSLSGGTNNTVEIYDLQNAGAGWSSPTTAPFSPPLYPRLFLLPNGNVFYAGQGSGTNNASAWIFNPGAGSCNPPTKTWPIKQCFSTLAAMNPHRVWNASNQGGSRTSFILLARDTQQQIYRLGIRRKDEVATALPT